MLSSSFIAAGTDGTFWLPPAVSTFAANTDSLFYFIYYWAVFFFFGIIGAMAFFAFKYRMKSENDKTDPIAGSHTLEIAWTVIPGILMLIVFVWGFVGFMDSAVPPGNAVDIRVTGQQWSWAYTHETGGTDTAELVVPVGEPVQLTMSSIDVIHSFYIPAMRVKRDVLPNRYTVLWFQAEHEGTYPVFCAEYCGGAHSAMISTVRVVSREEYDEYLSTLGGCPEGESLAECGENLYSSAGCSACHSVNGDAMTGPTFQGLYGSERQFESGNTAVADDNYIRTSIMNPMAEIVQGYPAAMPGNYAQTLGEEQITALIAYIQSLSE